MSLNRAGDRETQAGWASPSTPVRWQGLTGDSVFQSSGVKPEQEGRWKSTPGDSDVRPCLSTTDTRPGSYLSGTPALTVPSSALRLSGQYIPFRMMLPFLDSVFWGSFSFCCPIPSSSLVGVCCGGGGIVSKSSSFIQKHVLSNVFKAHAWLALRKQGWKTRLTSGDLESGGGGKGVRQWHQGGAQRRGMGADTDYGLIQQAFPNPLLHPV